MVADLILIAVVVRLILGAASRALTPVMPQQRYRTHEEWEARIAQARSTFGKEE